MPYYIRKKNDITWTHGESEIIISSAYFRISSESGTEMFELTEQAGSDNVRQNVSDIIVVDETNGGIQYNFTTSVNLSDKLNDLNYPHFVNNISILDEDDFLSNSPTKAPSQQSTRNFILGELQGITSGYISDLSISDTPSEDGFYLASENGTYTNAGNEVVDLSNGISVIVVSGNQTVFSQIVFPFTVNLGGEVVENETKGVTGGTVFDFYKNEQDKVVNIIEDGDLEDVTKWTSTNCVISQNGGDIDLTTTASISTKVFKLNEALTVDGNENFYLLIDVTNNLGVDLTYSALLAVGANIAFASSTFTVTNGSNVICVELDRGSFTYTGNVNLFINSPTNTAFDLTFKSVVIADFNVSDISTADELLNIYNTNGYFNRFEFKDYALHAINSPNKSEYNAFKSTTEAAISQLPLTSTYTNSLSDGNLEDVTKWTGTNCTISQNGNDIDLTASASISTKAFKLNEALTVSGSENFYILIDLTNNLTTDLTYSVFMALGANIAFASSTFIVTNGNNIICVELDRGSYTHTGNVNLFINSTTNTALDLTFNSVLLIDDANISTAVLSKLYGKIGFFTDYNVVNISKDSLDSDTEERLEIIEADIENLQTPSYPIIYTAEATGTSTPTEESNGVFRGVSSGFNAIQRAINAIDDNTTDKYIIRCYGFFGATAFADMSAVDNFGRSYKAFISLTGKRNIKIVGAGNKKTIISCILPNTGSSDYADYQNITMDCIDCELENLQIIGQNLRYPVHTETSGGINYNENSTMKFTNVHFWHKGNTGDALAQWTSLTAFGIGISKQMRMIFNNCRFTGKDYAGLGGHDGFGEENSVIELNNCFFDTWESPSSFAMTWNLFGNNNSKWKLILNNNNFGNSKSLNFSKNGNNDEFYVAISGSGNTKTAFITAHTDNYHPEFSDVLTNLVNTTGSTITQYSLVNADGTLTTGNLDLVCIDTPLASELFRAVKNTLLKFDDIPVKTGETIVTGDYVSADSGELIYSATATNAKIITHSGVNYLEL